MNAEEFRQTADLYLFAHGRKVHFQNHNRDQLFEMIGLIKIAGRNGAVVADSFSKVMEAINTVKAPTIIRNVNLTERKIATKLFSSEFPQISQIRKSAAHPGEFMKSVAEQDRHRVRNEVSNSSIHIGERSKILIADMMSGSDDFLKFGATVLGNFVEYELSLRKAETLTTVAAHYRQSFYPLEHPAAGQQRERTRESDLLRKQDQSSRPSWWYNLVQL